MQNYCKDFLIYKRASTPESKKERTHESTNLDLYRKDAG